eukprot:TRINITY_DN2924_c0_g1_i1.p1 TRINITY_DN2924_c0_g1~~TRINITY_DN2924_c0_g1_i1.p1  ORF type:complete len:337 (-),score=-3.64 TRINITY_DN2924_c0_g1_i1:440-1450(-)
MPRRTRYRKLADPAMHTAQCDGSLLGTKLVPALSLLSLSSRTSCNTRTPWHLKAPCIQTLLHTAWVLPRHLIATCPPHRCQPQDIFRAFLQHAAPGTPCIDTFAQLHNTAWAPLPRHQIVQCPLQCYTQDTLFSLCNTLHYSLALGTPCRHFCTTAALKTLLRHQIAQCSPHQCQPGHAFFFVLYLPGFLLQHAALPRHTKASNRAMSSSMLHTGHAFFPRLSLLHAALLLGTGHTMHKRHLCTTAPLKYLMGTTKAPNREVFSTPMPTRTRFLFIHYIFRTFFCNTQHLKAPGTPCTFAQYRMGTTTMAPNHAMSSSMLHTAWALHKPPTNTHHH